MQTALLSRTSSQTTAGLLHPALTLPLPQSHYLLVSYTATQLTAVRVARQLGFFHTFSVIGLAFADPYAEHAFQPCMLVVRAH